MTTASEDTYAILTLLYRYAEMLDEGDFAGVATLFVDADIIVGDTVTGHGSDHVETMLHAMVRIHHDHTPRTRHLITNPIIEFDGPDHAFARSCYTVLQPRGDRIDIVATGRHHDTFQRHHDRWKYSSRDYSYLDYAGDTTAHLL